MDCETCGTPLGGRWGNRCYRCRPGRPRVGVHASCQTCGREIALQPNQIRRGEGRYCSPACKHEAARGRELRPGGRYTRPDGYVAVKVGIGRYELEHRLVAEADLGRPLRSDEEVHHINGNKQDNRRENLLVVSPVEHQGHHTDHVQYMRRRVSLVCERCGKSYERKTSRERESRYCSASCRSRAVSLARWGHPKT